MVVTHAGKTLIYINKPKNVFKEYKWLIVLKKSSLNVLVSVYLSKR